VQKDLLDRQVHHRPEAAAQEQADFSLLMNKSPMRRICEVADIGPEGLYGEIDFLYRQCLAFAADREQRLLTGMAIPRLYPGVDRQDYIVNWTRHEDRRNVRLHAVGSADNNTGYVFGMHPDYDAALDADAVEQDAINAGYLPSVLQLLPGQAGQEDAGNATGACQGQGEPGGHHLLSSEFITTARIPEVKNPSS